MATLKTEYQVQPTLYIDIPTNFDIHPVKGDIVLIKNDEAVKRSIINIVRTSLFERRFRPDFGCNVVGQLFENFNDNTIYMVQQSIISAINSYEPRAKLIDVTVSSIDGNDNSLAATITFAINGASQQTTLTTTLGVSLVR